jgi:DsbC/DsbD-like thiol-disulfide interchange protein
MRLATTASVDYGYEGNVVLLSALQISKQAKPGTTIKVAGGVSWLVCADVCIPQRAELVSLVRVGEAVIDKNAESALRS